MEQALRITIQLKSFKSQTFIISDTDPNHGDCICFLCFGVYDTMNVYEANKRRGDHNWVGLHLQSLALTSHGMVC